MIQRIVKNGLIVAMLILSATGGVSAASDAPSQPILTGVAGITVDLHTGVMYAVDSASGLIFRVARGGVMTRFAGTGVSGFGGDGHYALETQFNHPLAVSFDQRTGDIFVADTQNYRIRSISPKDFSVRTVAGIGITTPLRKVPYDTHTPGALAAGNFAGDGGPATKAELNLPSGVCADPVGILFIADSGNHRIRAVNRGTSPVIVMSVEIQPDEIQTIAGTGTLGFSGDGGPARAAELAFPTELKVDSSGNLLFVDFFNQRLRKIDRQSGRISTVASGSIAGIPPDRALRHWAHSIVGVSVTSTQEIIYTDRGDYTVHRVSRSGENRVIYKTQPHQAEVASTEVGPNDEVYVTDVHWNRVLQLDHDAATVYVGGKPMPIISFPGVKTISGGRKE